MPILPPHCYVEMPCPFCGKPSAFVDQEHQPEIFETVLSFEIERTPPLTLAFVCGYCSTWLPPDVFCEKVSELMQVQREHHRAWERIVHALSA